MPEKFLPILKIAQHLRKSLQRLPLKTLRNSDSSSVTNNNPSADSSKNDTEFAIKGANLISGGVSDPEKRELKDLEDIREAYSTGNFVKIAQIGIVALTAVFLLLSLLNFYLRSQIDKRLNQLEKQADQLQLALEDTEELRLVSAQIRGLKDYKEDFTDLNPVVDLLLESAGSFKYTSISLDHATLSFSGTTSSPLTFSLLARRYLDSGLVDALILRSALVNKDKLYELSIEARLL